MTTHRKAISASDIGQRVFGQKFADSVPLQERVRAYLWDLNALEAVTVQNRGPDINALSVLPTMKAEALFKEYTLPLVQRVVRAVTPDARTAIIAAIAGAGVNLTFRFLFPE